jgi:error-prone DNA polymerase
MAKSIDAPRFASRGPEGVPFIGEADVEAPPLTPLADRLNELERARWPLFRKIVEEIADFPRHLSIHNGGMLITALPLVDTVPIERATMPDRNVVQFDKRDVEDLGLIKMDLLGLRTLSLIKDAVAMIDELHGVRLDLGTIALDDPAVYDLICEVDTIGLFQVESRAQAQALPRVLPRNFADIVVEVAIIRPGPLQGNMVNPYINRRQGREPVAYAHPLLEPILKETLGVILFQEQILRVSMAVAGFSAAEADKLRRAMSRARSSADMETLRGPFVRGALAHGVDDGTANLIFGQVAAFAEFGFCKSHAAAFALTAYHTAHLKLYYPAEFYVGLLSNQPMGFYSPAVIAGDAKRHGIAVLPVDVNRSLAKVCVEEREGGERPEVVDRSVTIAAHRACRRHDVRLGFVEVKGLGEAEADAIVREREREAFRSFDDFAKRVGLKEEALRNLALVGAFDSLGEPRRALLWRARDAHRSSPAFTRPVLALPTTAAPELRELNEQERAALDYRITGIPTGPQVMRFYRERLAARGVGSSADVQRGRHGSIVTVAGAMVVKQHPETAKGHVFLSLEDEYGLVNIIIRPATYAKYKPVVDLGGAVVVEGTLQHVDGVVSVLARRLDELALFVKLASRDWQ